MCLAGTYIIINDGTPGLCLNILRLVVEDFPLGGGGGGGVLKVFFVSCIGEGSM